MTHQRLMQDLGPEELAYWRATFDLEHEQYEEIRARAEREAKAKASERNWRVPR